MKWIRDNLGLNFVISNEVNAFKGQCAHVWPPHSPDLNPLDFFAWAQLKREALKLTGNGYFHTREECISVLKQAWANITQDQIRNACVKGVKDKLKKCVAVGGSTTKNYSNKKHSHLIPQ